MKTEEKLASTYISDFLNAMRLFQSEYEIAYEEVGKIERTETDLKHELELGSYKDRAKTATKLSRCLKERRQRKDEVELFRYVNELMQDKEFQRSIGKLTELLGKMRKQEAHMEHPKYYPRVLKDLPFVQARQTAAKQAK